MSKPITAVAMMMLYEEGAFQLTDPVAKFLPRLSDMMVWTPNGLIPAKTPITMHQLLTHTSGLSYGFNPDNPVDQLYREVKPQSAGDLEEFIDKVADLPLAFEPGGRWHYSFASDVLGAVAERITGLSFAEFLQRRLFDPLGMQDTFFSVDGENIDRFPTNHAWDASANKLTPLAADAEHNQYTDVSLYLGGQGLVSTLSDYMKFAEMLRNGGELGGVRILSPRTVDFMTRNHLSGSRVESVTVESPTVNMPTGVPGSGFGLGFGVYPGPIESGSLVSGGTYYWDGAAGTIFWVDPAEDLIVITMLQLLRSPWPLREEKTLLTYQAIVKSKQAQH
jgi:CubicO group peptidase (beta-lactamase class C family)